MTLEMAIIALARIGGSLPALRWAFWGGVVALLVDFSDLLMMNLIDLGGVRDYQTFDKYLDQVYLLAFLLVALRWQGLPKTIAIVLYLYRFAGFIAFEVTGERDLLLLFPNLFEFWFLLVAAQKQFQPGLRLTSVRPVMLVLAPLVALKLAQEYAIHYAGWFDGFTMVEAIEAVWRWLSGPFR
jgi:hypothetical protein